MNFVLLNTNIRKYFCSFKRDLKQLVTTKFKMSW